MYVVLSYIYVEIVYNLASGALDRNLLVQNCP